MNVPLPCRYHHHRLLSYSIVSNLQSSLGPVKLHVTNVGKISFIIASVVLQTF